MARRITPKLSKEITSTLRVYNRRITQAEKIGTGKIPSRITRKELENLSSKEIRKQLKSLKRFRAEKTELVESITPMSKYELQELRIQQRVARARLTRQIKELERAEIKVLGKRQGTTYGEMMTNEYTNLLSQREKLKKIDITKLDKKELELIKKNLSKMSRGRDLASYRQSIFEMIRQAVEPERAKIITNKLKDLTPSKLAKLVKEEQYIKDMLEAYENLRNASPKEREILMERIEEESRIIAENIDIIIADYV